MTAFFTCIGHKVAIERRELESVAQLQVDGIGVVELCHCDVVRLGQVAAGVAAEMED